MHQHEGSVGPRITDPNTRALACLRIAVGVLFLIFGEYKVFGAQFTLASSCLCLTGCVDVR